MSQWGEDRTNPRFARLVVVALMTAVVLCLLALLGLAVLGDDVVHT
jgi:hypothetical protein